MLYPFIIRSITSFLRHIKHTIGFKSLQNEEANSLPLYSTFHHEFALTSTGSSLLSELPPVYLKKRNDIVSGYEHYLHPLAGLGHWFGDMTDEQYRTAIPDEHGRNLFWIQHTVEEYSAAEAKHSEYFLSFWQLKVHPCGGIHSHQSRCGTSCLLGKRNANEWNPEFVSYLSLLYGIVLIQQMLVKNFQ
jgi:hypothetical protein